MKSRIRKGLICAFIFLMVLFQGVSRVGAAPSGKLDVKVEIGFNGEFKLGNYVPINIAVGNSIKNIQGELQIIIDNSVDYNGNSKSTAYVKEISISKDSTKNILMNVPINRANSKIKVIITDGKNKVYEDEIKAGMGTNFQSMYIGILSDEFDTVSYINKVPSSNYTSFANKVIKLDDKNFPSEFNTLKAFNVIVINNFDTSKLSKEQYVALKTWVIKGGTLIIGTGPSYSKTLAAFKDDFINGSIGSIKNIKTSALHSLISDGKNKSTMDINNLDLGFKDSVPVLSEGNMVILQRLQRGAGSIGITGFDLGLSPVSNWDQNNVLSEKLIKAVNPSLGGAINERMIYEKDQAYYEVNSALRNLSGISAPKTSNFLFILIAYIVIVAPINYIVLKRKDKRELMWITVPAISIVFAVIVYSSGFKTRLTKPVASVISILTMDSNGNINSNTYGSIFTPTKSSLKVEGTKGVTITAMDGPMNMGDPIMNDKKDVPEVGTRVHVSPKPYIEFLKMGVFESKLVNIEDESLKFGKIESTLNLANGSFSGNIENKSGMDFTECFIVTPNYFLSLGSFKDKENRTINQNGTSYGGVIEEFLDKAYNRSQLYNGGPMSAQQSKEMNLMSQKWQMMSMILYRSGRNISKPVIIAWSDSPISKDIFVNGKAVQKTEKSLLLSEIKVTFKNGSSIEYPAGYLNPEISNVTGSIGIEQAYGNVHGTGSAELIYDLGQEINATEFSITIGNQYGLDTYIWNVEKLDWEKFATSFSSSLENVKKYVSKENAIKIKVECNDMKGGGELPKISVKGSVR